MPSPGRRRRGADARDLRDLPWASIDNDDSRDLDQLSVAQPQGDAVRILVAIADVDAVVHRNSPLDRHASNNTTSVYTVPQVFPMLPEKLSTDLTSLNEGQDRLAYVVDLVVEPAGTLGRSEVYSAMVRNRAKLAYGGVGAWLEGTGPAPGRLAAVPGMGEQMRMQDRAAQALQGVRHAHGALTLQTTEARPVFDGDVLLDLRPDANNRAKELIEDFMIAANGVTARFLAAKGYPSLRRVLRTPEKWDQIAALAARLGDELPGRAFGAGSE